jgi:hypothetical protein
MNTKLMKLVEDYGSEYLRTTGKNCKITVNGAWLSVNGDKGVRANVLSQMLETLKTRPTVTDRTENVNGVPTLVQAHQHIVKNLMTGKDVIEDRDTPNCCSVARETYWSM